jgi:hypothetical protein
LTSPIPRQLPKEPTRTGSINRVPWPQTSVSQAVAWDTRLADQWPRPDTTSQPNPLTRARTRDARRSAARASLPLLTMSKSAGPRTRRPRNPSRPETTSEIRSLRGSSARLCRRPENRPARWARRSGPSNLTKPPCPDKTRSPRIGHLFLRTAAPRIGRARRGFDPARTAADPLWAPPSRRRARCIGHAPTP